MFSEAELRKVLPKGDMGSEIHYFESIGSTSQHAAELARANVAEGTLVVADEQTQGRGRGGRHWRTPRGCSLAMSLVLRPSPANAKIVTIAGIEANFVNATNLNNQYGTLTSQD